MGTPWIDRTKVEKVTVKSVKRVKLRKAVDVYDLSVPSYENFALDVGVFVHNCKKARMPWQEVLPLRGKLPNPIRTETSKFMANSEVSGIFTAIGVLPGGLYSSKSRRVGRLGFLPDADPDGRHINSELIAFVSRYLPDFLEQGKVFYIDAPLFVGSYHGTKKFANSTDELLKKFPEKDRKHVLVTRMKGWAEASAEDMRVIAMDPATRKVVQLTTSDADALIVNNIMGDDVAHRKEMLGIKEGSK